MKINTKYFGEVEVEDKSIINFPLGLPGFNEEKKFVLLNVEDNLNFTILQSVSNPMASFIMVNPFNFTNQYEFKLDDSSIELLKIEQEQDVAIYAILSIKEPFEQSTMNLQAPIVINHHTQTARQYILNSQKYAIRTPVIEQAASAEKED